MPLVISDKAALSRIYGRIIPEDAVGLAPANAIVPNTYRELSTPSEIDSKDFEEISTPNQVEQVSGVEIATPNNLSSESLGEISAVNSLTPEEEGLFKQPRNIPNVFPEFIQNVRTPDEIPAKEISAPNTVSPEAEEEIKIPNSVGSLPERNIYAPNTVAPESSGAMATPNAINPNAADPVSPPFPTSNARILYENLLAGGNAEYDPKILTAATYERAKSSSSTWFINAYPSTPQQIDTIALAAHNFGSLGATVKVRTASTKDGMLVDVDTVTLDNDRALMFLFAERTVARISIRVDAAGAKELGVVYAGISLQMQRPIFGGHSPINYSAVTNYNSNASDAGQWLGRDIVRQGLEGSYSWDFLTDDWYREYFQPFVESAKKNPFFISWRPDLYPDEVAYCWTTGDISPSNRGGSTKFMSVSMNVQGYAQ